MRDTKLGIFADIYIAMRTGRRLVVIESGCLAWCPQSCQRGDAVVVLASGKAPFILRKLKNNYRLLGDACVRKIMDGDAIGKMLSSGRQWDEIDLD